MDSFIQVVQLFNSGRESQVQSSLPGTNPDYHRASNVLRDAGFEIETLSPYGFPWNPAANLHNAYRGLDLLRAIRVMIKYRKTSIVCAHLESALLILMLRRLFRFRSSVVLWEVPWSPGWAYRGLVRSLAIPKAEVSVVFSSSQIDVIKGLYGYDTPVRFIPFCVDLDFYHPISAPKGIEPYILSCGLDVGRDFEIVIQATSGLRVPVVIKGREALLSQSPRAENLDVIVEHFSYTQYRELYAGASVVVIATRRTINASGVTTLMEAMAMGKPVIVSDNPALADYLPPPAAGIVIPVGDSAALRSALLELALDPEKAESMGRKAREFAEQRFSPAAHYAAVARLFEDVIQRGRSVDTL